MRSTTVVSSNLSSLTDRPPEVQLTVWRVKRSGESTHPWRTPVVTFLVPLDCRRARKIVAQFEVVVEVM